MNPTLPLNHDKEMKKVFPFLGDFKLSILY